MLGSRLERATGNLSLLASREGVWFAFTELGEGGYDGLSITSHSIERLDVEQRRR